MPLVRSARRAVRRRGASLVAVTSVLVLAVSGCSSPVPGDAAELGGSEQQAAISSVLEQLESMGVDPDSGELANEDAAGDDHGVDSGPRQQQAAPPITLWLPNEPAADPAGWQRSPVQCEDREAAIGSAFVSFAVPGEWELGARGGGSGGPESMGFDYRYRPADIAEVKIKIESDSRDGDGELVMYDGQPESESTFDYDYSVDQDIVRITHESLGEVPVGDSTAELFVARPEQAPDRLHDVVYKARIDQIDMPRPMFDDSWTVAPYSFVIEISHLPEKGELPEETVRSIVSSLVMPECSVTHAIVLAELNSQRDVDGDGHIADQQDFMDALQMGG